MQMFRARLLTGQYFGAMGRLCSTLVILSDAVALAGREGTAQTAAARSSPVRVGGNPPHSPTTTEQGAVALYKVFMPIATTQDTLEYVVTSALTRTTRIAKTTCFP